MHRLPAVTVLFGDVAVNCLFAATLLGLRSHQLPVPFEGLFGPEHDMHQQMRRFTRKRMHKAMKSIPDTDEQMKRVFKRMAECLADRATVYEDVFCFLAPLLQCTVNVICHMSGEHATGQPLQVMQFAGESDDKTC